MAAAIGASGVPIVRLALGSSAEASDNPIAGNNKRAKAERVVAMTLDLPAVQEAIARMNKIRQKMESPDAISHLAQMVSSTLGRANAAASTKMARQRKSSSSQCLTFKRC